MEKIMCPYCENPRAYGLLPATLCEVPNGNWKGLDQSRVGTLRMGHKPEYPVSGIPCFCVECKQDMPNQEGVAS